MKNYAGEFGAGINPYFTAAVFQVPIHFEVGRDRWARRVAPAGPAGPPYLRGQIFKLYCAPLPAGV